MAGALSYPEELKQHALRLREAGKSLRAIASELGVSHQTVRNWVTEPEPELGPGDQEELVRLRRQVRRLEQERDILKKAVAFFAKEHEDR